MKERTEEFLGKNIQRKRKSKNYTQDTLADLLKIDRTSISKYENGVNGAMGINLFVELCDALNTTPNELLWEGEKWESGEKYNKLSKDSRNLIDIMINKLFILERTIRTN